MDAPLLATKLVVPPTPDWLVPRPRLLDLLTAGVGGPLTLVVAPAGAGKTMLLGSWVRSGRSPGPVAWLSLDPDDDEQRFWAYLLASLQASGAVPPDGSLAALAPPRAGHTDAFLPLLVKGLGELPGPVVAVVDDLHEPSDQGILGGVEFLLRHAPPQLRLVLTTRTNPALPVTRMRVEGAATEVRVADLAFTRTEAAELLAGLPERPSDSDVTALWTRTEGWAAGLRLAFLSLHGHPDPAGFVAAFSGDDRAVADYLIAEVLTRQPTEVRDFLLDISVADQVSGELADAITGRKDSARRLAELERTNAFVVAVDPGRTWYRYHRLFAELLRAELRHQRSSEAAAELHRRAARWHATDGISLHAVGHALTAEDWDYAAALLAERWGDLLAESVSILAGVVARLPPRLIEDDAELAMIAATSRLAVDDLAGADAYLRLVELHEAAVPDDRRARFAAGWALTRLHRARVTGDLDGVRATAGELLALAPTLQGGSRWSVTADGLRLFGLVNLGTAELWCGELEPATGHLEEALALGDTMTTTAGEEFPQLNCLSQLALVEVARGRLRQAEERGQAAVAFAERRGWSQALQAFGGHLALAWARYQRDDLTAADEHLGRATQAAHERTAMVAAALVRSWLLASRGNPDQGLAALRSALAAVRYQTGWQPPPVLSGLVLTSEARLLAATGDTRAARALLAGADADGSPFAQVALVLARVQQADGDLAGAAATLAGCLDSDPGQPIHPFLTLESLVLDAVVQAELGAHDRAARSLERALRLAAADGYRRVFVDGGKPVRRLLTRQLERGTEHTTLVAWLLRAPGQEIGDVSGAPADALVEPLSERERTVLHYLPSGLSISEIAGELYVSANTVKTHCKSIYRKLEVNGRRDAVAAARRLGLL